MIITSASNAAFKHIRSLAEKKFRRQYREYTVEGIKSVSDALRSGRRVKTVVVSEGFDALPDIGGAELVTVSESLFSRLCDTRTPQGIMAVIDMADGAAAELDINKPYIYCDGVNDPGNLGTIIRTADAAGFGGVLISKGSADLYSPKTVRASMGSFFNIDTFPELDADFLAQCKERGFELYGGALGKDTIDYKAADFTKPTIIIVGNEANGISKNVLEMCQSVKIPIIGRAESLNVSVAAALLMYELVSQRS